MTRSSKAILPALVLALVPLSAYAQTVRIVDGGFEFVHALAAPDGECVNPPGLHFAVTSERFDGALVTTTATIPFTGDGEADGCAFFEPVLGVAAVFDGSFTWRTDDGKLRGTFLLLDFPTDTEGVFAAVVFIEFDGGTRMFKGARGFATSEGFDFPFGYLGGDPAVAGVTTYSIRGVIEVED